MTDIKEEIEDLKKRINRCEAALEEMFKGVAVYKNDKAYEDKEKKERAQ